MNQQPNASTDSEDTASGVDIVLGRLGQFVGRFPESNELSPAERSALGDVATMLEKLGPLTKNDAESRRLFLARMIVLGKLGDFDAAIAEATAVFDTEPSWHHAVSLGNIYRRAGDLPNAILMWAKAAELDPDDVTALLEIGDAYLILRDWAAALEHYELVLKRNPEHPWAIPSIDFCRYRQTGNPQSLESLKERANPKLDECCSEVKDVLGQIADPDPVIVKRAKELLQMTDDE